MILQAVSAESTLQPLLKNADHVDVKTFSSEATLREFVAGLFSYNPRWLMGLYGMRWAFVRLLGMKQDGVPMGQQLQPTDVSMTSGDSVAFFQIEAAEDKKYWIASAKEKHLDAYLGIVVEPTGSKVRKFHLVTIVHYQHWTGPVYFNVIRPFHHLVVNKMGRAAVQYRPKGAYT